MDFSSGFKVTVSVVLFTMFVGFFAMFSLPESNTQTIVVSKLPPEVSKGPISGPSVSNFIENISLVNVQQDAPIGRVFLLNPGNNVVRAEYNTPSEAALAFTVDSGEVSAFIARKSTHETIVSLMVGISSDAFRPVIVCMFGIETSDGGRCSPWPVDLWEPGEYYFEIRAYGPAPQPYITYRDIVLLRPIR